MSIQLDVYKINEPEDCSGIEKYSYDNFHYEDDLLLFTLSYYENILIVQELLGMTFDKRLDYGDDGLYLIEKCEFLKAWEKYYQELRDSLNFENYKIEHLNDFFITVKKYIQVEEYLFFNIG